MTIAVDFDGAIVRNNYPEIGTELPFATRTLKMLINDRHQLILWSTREGKLLDDAVEWCRERGVEFYAINKDFPDEDLESKHYSRKLKVDMWIDSHNLGGLPDWGTIYRIISEKITYEDVLRDEMGIPKEKPKKHWWQR